MFKANEVTLSPSTMLIPMPPLCRAICSHERAQGTESLNTCGGDGTVKMYFKFQWYLFNITAFQNNQRCWVQFNLSTNWPYRQSWKGQDAQRKELPASNPMSPTSQALGTVMAARLLHLLYT